MGDLVITAEHLRKGFGDKAPDRRISNSACPPAA